MYPIGLSTCVWPLNEKVFAAYEESGLTDMEVSLTKAHLETLDTAALKRNADRHHIRLWSCHLPFSPFSELDISSLNETVRVGAVAYQSEQLRRMAKIGITRFVIHPSGEPIRPEQREARMQAACDSLRALVQAADAAGAVLAVENLPRTCLGRDAAEMRRLLSADRRLRLCFDTNHLLTQTGEEFLAAVGDRLLTLHVSDYDRADEKHWLPGEGVIDWQSLYGAIKKTGFSGVWMYEVSIQPPATRPRCRTLTYADYVRNAREIFSGAPLTVIPTVQA